VREDSGAALAKKDPGGRIRFCVVPELGGRALRVVTLYFADAAREKRDTMDPRYPIGQYASPQQVTPALREQAISAIAEAPAKLRAAVKGLNDEQLNTPYREGGWSVRQVAHHVRTATLTPTYDCGCADRAGADDQALRGSTVGRTRGCQISTRRSVAGPAGFSA